MRKCANPYEKCKGHSSWRRGVSRLGRTGRVALGMDLCKVTSFGLAGCCSSIIGLASRPRPHCSAGRAAPRRVAWLLSDLFLALHALSSLVVSCLERPRPFRVLRVILLGGGRESSSRGLCPISPRRVQCVGAECRLWRSAAATLHRRPASGTRA